MNKSMVAAGIGIFLMGLSVAAFFSGDRQPGFASRPIGNSSMSPTLDPAEVPLCWDVPEMKVDPKFATMRHSNESSRAGCESCSQQTNHDAQLVASANNSTTPSPLSNLPAPLRNLPQIENDGLPVMPPASSQPILPAEIQEQIAMEQAAGIGQRIANPYARRRPVAVSNETPTNGPSQARTTPVSQPRSQTWQDTQHVAGRGNVLADADQGGSESYNVKRIKWSLNMRTALRYHRESSRSDKWLLIRPVLPHHHH